MIMKHLFILCLSFLISTADAQQAIRFINLTGTAEHIVDADEIVFNIQVRTTAKSLDEAKKKNDEQISNIRKILAELNIKKDDFEIHPISLGKEYEWQNNKRVDKGFFAATNVTFKLKDFSRYYEATDKLASSDNFTVNSYYNLSNFEFYNKTTYQKALIAEKEKAEYMTKALNINIGKVLEIEETGDYQPPMLMRNKMEMDSASGETIAGKITIRKSIQVKFELID